LASITVIIRQRVIVNNKNTEHRLQISDTCRTERTKRRIIY